jgi:hypothetical protein
MTDKPIYDPDQFVEFAKSLQKSLRWVSVGSFVYAASTLVGLYFSVMSWTTVVASVSASCFVYHIHYKLHGHMKNWWWMKRGIFLSVKQPEQIKEAEEWAKEMFPSRYFMPNDFCFKFFQTSDAVAFKLVWC